MSVVFMLRLSKGLANARRDPVHELFATFKPYTCHTMELMDLKFHILICSLYMCQKPRL